MDLTGKQAVFIAGVSSVVAMSNILATDVGVKIAYSLTGGMFASIGALMDPGDLIPLLDAAWSVILDPATDMNGVDPEHLRKLRDGAGDVKEALHRMHVAVAEANGSESEA